MNDLQTEHDRPQQVNPDAPQVAESSPSDAPWNVAQQHGDESHEAGEDGRPPRPYRGPGAVTHDKPTLTTGAAGADVEELVRLLSVCGYTNNSLCHGQNSARVLDTSIMNDVARFCEDHGVSNDRGEFEGKETPAAGLVANHVGPYIWQALIDAAAEAEG